MQAGQASLYSMPAGFLCLGHNGQLRGGIDDVQRHYPISIRSQTFPTEALTGMGPVIRGRNP